MANTLVLKKYRASTKFRCRKCGYPDTATDGSKCQESWTCSRCLQGIRSGKFKWPARTKPKKKRGKKMKMRWSENGLHIEMKKSDVIPYVSQGHDYISISLVPILNVVGKQKLKDIFKLTWRLWVFIFKNRSRRSDD